MMPLDGEKLLTPTDREEETQAAGPTLPVVTFTWGTEMYGLPLTDVGEVAKVGSIAQFPGLPAALLGAVNLRGEVLPVVDLRGFLNLNPGRPTSSSRLVVVTHRAERVGLLVDSIGDVLDVTPPDRTTAASDLVTGQSVLPDGRLLTLLDVTRALSALAKNA